MVSGSRISRELESTANSESGVAENQKKIRVLLFIDSIDAGGAQRQMVVLANGLAKMGIDVMLVNYFPGSQLIDQLDQSRVKRIVVLKKGKLDIRFGIALYRLFKRYRPHVLVSYLNTANLWARLVGPIAGIRGIITSERSLDIARSRKKLMLEKFLAPLSSRIVLNAYAIQNALISHGIDPEKTVVIQNGVDTRYFSKIEDERVLKFRNRVGIKPDALLMTLPARLTREKNHQGLVAALQDFGSLPQRLHVLFVGNEFDPSIRAGIEAMTRADGFSDRISFFPAQKDMPVVYGASDIVVLPSVYEGFPNVIVEAMACERVVLASNVSDNPQIVRHGVDGFLFDIDCPRSLDDALEQVFSLSPGQAEQVGLAARSVVVDKFSEERLITKNLNLISAVANQCAGR